MVRMMAKLRLSIVTVCLLPAAALAGGLPINPDVTPQTMRETICVPGWTKTVRPPVSYTNGVKRRLLSHGERMASFELDHVIPLTLGGNPTDKANLKLQEWPEAREKDKVEVCLSRAVCRGKITLDAARAAIWTDWRAAKSKC